MLIGGEAIRKVFVEEIKRIERIKASEEIGKLRRKSRIEWNGAEEIRIRREP